MLKRGSIILWLFLTVTAIHDPAEAKTLTWANDGDVNSLDPYARQETFLLAFNLNIYDSLVRSRADLTLEPSLATEWKAISPTVWRFTLRKGVKFQDGTPFSADDVVFSYHRASGPGSNVTGFFAAVKDVRKVDDTTVDIETKAPNGLLTEQLSQWAIMSKTWCEHHNATQPADLTKNEESFATRNAMGTGAFMVKSREPDVKTVLVPNPLWWDKPTHNLDEITFLRIANGPTRVAALRSGQVDMVLTVPPQDIEPLRHADGIKIVETAETRAIYLGFDQLRDELLWSDVKGTNPFKDQRVRKAFWLAIDNDAIKLRVMRGQSLPEALIFSPAVIGYDKTIDLRPPYDPAAARALLAEAGYPHGFGVTMDCPNDRYVNDEAICQAVVGMLAKIGVRIELRVQTKQKFFAQVIAPAYAGSFFIGGWAPIGSVAMNTLTSVIHSRTTTGLGTWNLGGYSNPAIDQLIDAAAMELDPTKRQDLIRKAAILHRDDVGHVPLHAQFIDWAVRSNVEPAIQADNVFQFRLFRVN